MASAVLQLSAKASKTFLGSPLRPGPAGCVVSSCRRPASVTTRAGVAPVPLPNEYGYVILTAASSAFLVQWQAVQMYEDAEPSVFNCYQRAHQNTLENYPTFLALLAIGGLAYPITSSVLGMIWVVGRVVYSLGYYTGDPQNRMRGAFNFIGFLDFFITCIVFGVRQTGLLGV